MAKQEFIPKGKDEGLDLVEQAKELFSDKATRRIIDAYRAKKSPKDKALAYLNAALDSGVRGANKDAIQNAIHTILDDGRSGLTDRACMALKYGQKPLRDPKYIGLRLEAKKKGKIWFYRYSFGGKQHQVQFGIYPDVSLAKAHELHDDAVKNISAGNDPTSGTTSSMTVDQLCNEYLKHAELRKRSWKDDKRQIDKDIRKAWGEQKDKYGNITQHSKLACKITHEDASKLINEVYETRNSPRGAETLLAVGRFMYNVATGDITKAKRKQWFTPSFNTRINPWFEIKKNPFADVDLPDRDIAKCTLKGKYLKSYLKNFDTADFSDDVRNVLKLQLWCNTRISEPALMDWREVDLDEGIWTIPARRTKTNAQHDVMLPAQAIKLLKSLKPKSSGRVFGFVEMRPENVINHIAEQVRKNREHLGVVNPDMAPFTTHSLRHTGQTFLAGLKCPVEVRDRIANHKPAESIMSNRYNASDYDEDAREWLQTMADKLDELTMPNVVQIGDRDAN